MYKKAILTIAVSLIVGAGIGYLLGSSRALPEQQEQVSESAEAPASTHGATADAMVQELKDTSGSARDEAFLESMIVHHQSAIDMSEILLESTKRPELQQLTKDIIATQTREIETMKGWLNTWYGR